MPQITLSDVVRIQMVGAYLAQEVITTFYYGTNDAIETLADIAAGFLINIDTPLIACLNENVLYVQLLLQRLTGSLDFLVYPISSRGGRTGDGLPPFVAYDITNLRAGLGERNGYLRLPGVSETDQIDGVAVPAQLTRLSTLCTALNTPIVPVASSYQLLIRRTAHNNIPFNPPVFFTKGLSVYSKIGSQNSRKYGRGA